MSINLIQTVARIHRKRVLNVAHARFCSVHSARAECDLVTTHKRVTYVVKARCVGDQGRQHRCELETPMRRAVCPTAAPLELLELRAVDVTSARCHGSASRCLLLPPRVENSVTSCVQKI